MGGNAKQARRGKEKVTEGKVERRDRGGVKTKENERSAA